MLLGFLGPGHPKPRPAPSTQPPPPSRGPALLPRAPSSQPDVTSPQCGSALPPQACLSSLAPLPPAHRCLGRAGDPEHPVPHHSPKPLTPGSSPGLNLQGCRRNPILATERRQPPERLPCNRAAAAAGRRPWALLREGRGAPTTELRGFLNYRGLKAFQKCDNFGGLRPTQENLALAGARWGGA